MLTHNGNQALLSIKGMAHSKFQFFWINIFEIYALQIT